MQDECTPELSKEERRKLQVKEAGRRYRERNREKLRERQRAYYAANKELCLEMTKRWEKANPGYKREYQKRRYHEIPEERERVLRQCREHQARNPERTRERKRAYKKRNPLKGREYAERRYAWKKGSTVTQVDLQTILEKYGRICHICGDPIGDDLHFDHIIPLSKGGPHSVENLAPAHASCNQSKGAKMPHNAPVPLQEI